jgi:hypothetical protein
MRNVLGWWASWGRAMVAGLALLPLQIMAADVPDEVLAQMRAAFVYGYPYHEFMWLREQALNVPTSSTSTTLNTFRHQRQLAGPQDRWANGPINDTFYSTAWIDLAAGPVVLSLPDTQDRYYVLVLVAADVNSFEYLGRRSTGTRARKVAVVGPGWQGPVPEADQVVRSPSRDVYLNLRVLVRDPSDVAAAHAVQDGFTVAQSPSATPPQGPAVRPQAGNVERMLAVINEAIERNPPPAAEAPLLARYRAVGICGAACRWSDLGPELQARWTALVPPMVASFKSALDADRRDIPRVNGWVPFRLPRSFGTNYRMRAGAAANSGGIFGLEAPEASYFFGLSDDRDEALGQGRSYRLRLPQGQLPADAFWSITLYEVHPEGQYLSPNALDRYSISDRTPGLQRNADGSLDVWIQPVAPDDPQQRANWLPSPATRRFVLNARAYQPRAEVLEVRWAMPPVERRTP